MNKLLLIAFVTLSVASCNEEMKFGDGSTGTISAGFEAKGDISSSITSRASEEQITVPEIEDFAVALIKDDGSYSGSWDSTTDFPSWENFVVGTYTLSASYGDETVEGFDAPYFYGETEFDVYSGEESQVGVTCQLANTMVSVEYTDAFKNYFEAYSAVLYSTGGTQFDYANDETRAIYLKSNSTITLQLSLTKTNGVASTYEPAAITNVLPKTHYTITVDVNGGEVGEAGLVITFDDTTIEEPIEVLLDDNLLEAKAPEIVTTGYSTGNTIELYQGDTFDSELTANITAMSGISEVTMTTSSKSLIAAGWPESINLVAASESEKSKLTAMGLKVTGLWSNVDKMAIVEFTDVIQYMSEVDGDPMNSISLQVKDIYSKVLETPSVLAVQTTAIDLSIAEPNDIIIGQSVVEATVSYNGLDFENSVAIMARNQYGAWSECVVSSAVKSGDGYLVTFTIPLSNEDVEVMAVYTKTSVASNIVTYQKVTPEYSLVASEGAAWANKATISISVDDTNLLETLVEFNAIYQSSDNGATWSKSTVTADAAMNLITVTGLTPETNYLLKGTITDSATNSNFTAEIAITTEAMSVLPNASFETTTQTINVSSINQGGKCGGWFSAKYLTTSYSVYEPTGWASVNAKTCNTSVETQNTWFVIPSTYSTSTAQSGSNAMVLRNVAWDADGEVPADDTSLMGTSYNSNIPTIANRSAGKLFLGTYSYSNGTETYNEGYSFTSRPSSLKGYYKYAIGPDSSEKGMVTIQIVSDGTVIGSATATLSTASSFTAFEVPISYTDLDKKATQIKVMFASSNYASYTQSEETSKIQTTSDAQSATSTGAVLTVDNISLVY
ncbi:MAG: DUF4493 domain-containing protein [Bacteroidales bacterium]